MSLIAENLVKSYGGRRVVDGVGLRVDRGEVVGLPGPNGAGKTTSFYMMVGAVRADEGTVTLDGQNLAGAPMHVRCRKGIGYLAQQPSVFRKLSVRDNLRLVLEMQGLSRQEQRERADGLLAKLHISHIADRIGLVLSGGERRRVEIARALCISPSFILLDEPFSGVDPIAVADVQQIIRELKSKNLGILVTDHNVRETLSVTDRAYLIHSGEILIEGTAERLINDPEARRIYLGEDFRI